MADAGDGVGEDALDDALREGAVVVGHVLGELVEAHLVGDLSGAVGFGFDDVGFLRTGLGTHNDDAVVDHVF